jgi:thioredoxin reductase (NADPH)
MNNKEDTLIVGAGPIGLACAISARRRGRDPLVIDSGAIVDSIQHYPTGMTFFTTPELLEIGGHPFPCAGDKPTREEALMYYRGVVRAERIRIQTFTKLVTARQVGGKILCDLDLDVNRQHPSAGRATATTRGRVSELVVSRLVLATGYYHHPNRLGVPGEDLPHVRHYFDEAHPSSGLDVVVIGGKNSAIEAALLLFRAGAKTTLVYRGDEFSNSVKYWIKPDIENRIKAGEIQAYLGAEVVGFGERSVTIRPATGPERKLPADRVYALTGFHPDIDLFRRIGIHVNASTGVPNINSDTLETNISGIFMAGSIVAGYATSNVFIENGRFDGEKIFGS